MRIKREQYNLVLSLLYEIYLEKGFKCVSCGAKLNFDVQDAWIENESEAWLYIHCSSCSYDNALYKILRLTGVEI
jgi:DNA-directed RNA polymerase subunit RPC12/RpoP